MQEAPGTPSEGYKKKYSGFILIFVLIKISLNLLAISKFGFQRDELLHFALADHLDWGYIEVPPLIALMAKTSASIFGDSVFAARLFPTLCSGLIVWFSGLTAVELGGKKFAIALTCLALIFSPAFAASGYLFEPVVFDQLWWVLSLWLLIKYCNTRSIKYIYYLAMAIGFGLLTKYTMAFFALALIAGFLAGNQRKLLLNRHVFAGILLTSIIFLPNLIWQFQHAFPVFNQMATLKKNQLDQLNPSDFVLQQLVDNGAALLLWLPGFALLLLSPSFRKYQFIAFSFVLIFSFFLAMNGKNYYLFGAYPVLFAAGGVFFEKWLKRRTAMAKTAVATVLTLPNFFIFPIALPILSLNQTIGVVQSAQKKFPFLNFVVLWDDHQLHAITQNYGDMLGWKELTAKVGSAWLNLTPEQRRHTQIYADNYGEASALNHYGKPYNLPTVISLDSSFALWAPGNLDGNYIIYVDEEKGRNVEKLQSRLERSIKVGCIENPFSIENGTAIFLLVHPKQTLNELYKKDRADKLVHRLI
jgi:4-amino-4-deoxy-L-arabinose transferase-like glycosyltransferase